MQAVALPVHKGYLCHVCLWVRVLVGSASQHRLTVQHSITSTICLSSACALSLSLLCHSGKGWAPSRGMHTALGTLLRFGPGAFDGSASPSAAAAADADALGGDEALPHPAGGDAQPEGGHHTGVPAVPGSGLRVPGALHVQVLAVRGLPPAPPAPRPTVSLSAAVKVSLAPWLSASGSQSWQRISDMGMRCTFVGVKP